MVFKTRFQNFIAVFFAFLICVTPVRSNAYSTIETAFSPSSDTTALIVRTIQSAQTSVEVAIFKFNSMPIAEALLNAHKAGKSIRIIVDKTQQHEDKSVVDYLVKQGVPVRVDNKHTVMHNKFLVIDEKTIETGSFNYNHRAEKQNAENVIVIHDNADLAAKYLQHWQQLWDNSDNYVVQ